MTQSSSPVSHFQPSSIDESQEEECDQTANQKDLLLSHFGQFPGVKKVNCQLINWSISQLFGQVKAAQGLLCPQSNMIEWEHSYSLITTKLINFTLSCNAVIDNHHKVVFLLLG